VVRDGHETARLAGFQTPKQILAVLGAG